MLYCAVVIGTHFLCSFHVVARSDVFAEAVSAVPAWMFLAWTSQVMAMLSTEAARAIVPVMKRVCTTPHSSTASCRNPSPSTPFPVPRSHSISFTEEQRLYLSTK